MTAAATTYSRPVATAERLGDAAEDRHRFLDKRVLLTGEAMVLATENGRACLLDSLRLLVRICRNLDVAIPTTVSRLYVDARHVAEQVAVGQAVRFLDGPVELAEYDAILSVGVAARPELPWTVINAHGWLARVSSGPTDLSPACDQRNPIAALAAASLGTAEVFKRLLHLRPERGALLDGVAFSLDSYEVNTHDPGPAVPEQLDMDLVVIGAGAIGNGMIHLLGQLRPTGRVAVIDRQAYGQENLGTSLLIGPRDIGIDKATFAAEILTAAGIRAVGFREDIDRFAERLGSELPHPPVVLTGLDSIEARHAAQDLWPDLIIDGAIGDFGCQVSRHPWNEDTACLRCLFRQPVRDAAERIASRASGLNEARTRGADAPVTEADVLAAPPEKRNWLRERIGHSICSVIGEATAQLLTEEQQRHGFEPSVPFVACLSASMAIAELVKFSAGRVTTLEPRYQLDVLRGPMYGQQFPQERRRDCLCVFRRPNIEKLRRRRATSAA